MSNLEYLITRPGILKIVTIGIGVTTFTLTSHSYTNSPYTDFYADHEKIGNASALPGTELELFEVSATGAFLFCSIVYLILYAWIYELCESRVNKVVDTVFHAFVALFLFAAGCVGLYASVEIEDYGCTAFEEYYGGRQSIIVSSSDKFFCHHFVEKVVGAVFNIVNGGLYCLTAIVVVITKEL